MPASVKLMIAINVFVFLASNSAAVVMGKFGIGNVVFDAIWLAVIYGLTVRSRVSWQLVRGASLLNTFAALFLLMVTGANRQGLVASSLLLVLSFICFKASGRLAAREWFELRCPTCSRMTSSVRMLTGFRKAFCELCAVSW